MSIATIKLATEEAHQQLEGLIIRQIKSIQSTSDYLIFLQRFYFGFQAIEQQARPFLFGGLVPDYESRRNSDYLRRDIEQLGDEYNTDFNVAVPLVANASEALGMQYVLEGSIMGGPYIIDMLRKNGIREGFSFFSGYGKHTPSMWEFFKETVNQHTASAESLNSTIKGAQNAFNFFIRVFSLPHL